jgi:hypothetical protein
MINNSAFKPQHKSIMSSKVSQFLVPGEEVPDTHQRHSMVKLSLFSGTGGNLMIRPMDLLASGSQYEQSSEDQSMISSCSPDKLAKGLSGSHSNTEGGTTINYSEHSSLVKGMAIMTEDVDEDLCSESESGDEDLLAPEIEFNPRNFYWLFNPDLGFSQRPTFDINDDINPQDFLAMRRVNRSVLTSFFSTFQAERPKKVAEFSEKPAWGSERRAHESDEEMEEVKLTSMSSQMPATKSSFVHDNLNLMWEDAALDKVAKRTLRVADNGRFLPLDMVAHLEFFYNTLLMSHETSNPFKRPRSYQALLFPYKTRSGRE